MFQCAEDPESLDLVRKYQGLKPLIDFIESYTDDKSGSSRDTLLAVTGAIWKLALSPLNVAEFGQLGATPLLINFLRTGMPENVSIWTIIASVLCYKLTLGHADENQCLAAWELVLVFWWCLNEIINFVL